MGIRRGCIIIIKTAAVVKRFALPPYPSPLQMLPQPREARHYCARPLSSITVHHWRRWLKIAGYMWSSHPRHRIPLATPPDGMGSAPSRQLRNAPLTSWKATKEMTESPSGPETTRWVCTQHDGRFDTLELCKKNGALHSVGRLDDDGVHQVCAILFQNLPPHTLGADDLRYKCREHLLGNNSRHIVQMGFPILMMVLSCVIAVKRMSSSRSFVIAPTAESTFSGFHDGKLWEKQRDKYKIKVNKDDLFVMEVAYHPPTLYAPLTSYRAGCRVDSIWCLVDIVIQWAHSTRWWKERRSTEMRTISDPAPIYWRPLPELSSA